jgi:UDP-N-acetylglucosamine 2-epimerase (hydrolysing)
VVIAPNNDPGTDAIFQVIEALPKDRFRLIPSMRFNYFSELMKNASAMIGNSSAGVREAPFLGLPSLDVGTRQNSRGIAESIANAEAMDTNGMNRFLQHSWSKHFIGSMGFGAGTASEKFINVLSTHEYWLLPSQKAFNDPH